MEYWHRFTADEAARKLNTDVSIGRTSHRKSSRKERNSVFLLPTADIRGSMRCAVSDAAVMIFFITALISLIIGDFWESFMSLAVLVLACVFSGKIKHNSRLRIVKMSERALPKVRLLSEGKLRTVDCRDLAVGDVIYLSRGDVVPVDCRLISSMRLKVAEYYTDPATGKRKGIAVEKKHDVLYGESDELESYDNMLYAGSSVVFGKCKAIVVAIGKDTRAGVVDSGIKIMPDDPLPPYFNHFSKRCRIFATVMLISVLPITLIGVVCQSDGGMGIVDVFVLAVAIALASVSELSVSPSEQIITGTLTLAEDSPACIINPSRAEVLSDADTLVIVCQAALMDTERKVHSVFFGGKDVGENVTFGSLKILAEKVDKLVAASELHDRKLPSYIDTEALGAYVSDMGISRRWNLSESEKAIPRIDVPFAGVFSAEVTDEVNAKSERVFCSLDGAMIRSCRKYRSTRDLHQLSGGQTAKAIEFYDEYVRRGFNVHVIVSESSAADGMILEGIIATGIVVPQNNKKAVADLLSIGVRPMLIIPDENPASLRVARVSCIAYPDLDNGSIAVASEMVGADISDLVLSHSVFVGFGNSATADICRALAQSGARAVSVIYDKKTPPFTSAITVENVSTDAAKLSSAASIKAASVKNDDCGLSALRVLFEIARAAKEKLKACGEYFFTCAVFRAVFAVIPLFAGRADAVLQIPMLLSLGLFGDLAAVSVLSFAECSLEKQERESKREERSYRIIVSFCGAFLGALATVIGMLFLSKGMLTAGNYAAYALSVTAFFQLAVLCMSLLRAKASVFNPRFLVLLGITAVICAVPFFSLSFSLPQALLSPFAAFFGTCAAHKLFMLCAPVTAMLTSGVIVLARVLKNNLLGVDHLNK